MLKAGEMVFPRYEPPTGYPIQKGHEFKKEQGKVYGGGWKRKVNDYIIIP